MICFRGLSNFKNSELGYLAVPILRVIFEAWRAKVSGSDPEGGGGEASDRP